MWPFGKALNRTTKNLPLNESNLARMLNNLDDRLTRESLAAIDTKQDSIVDKFFPIHADRNARKKLFLRTHLPRYNNKLSIEEQLEILETELKLVVINTELAESTKQLCDAFVNKSIVYHSHSKPIDIDAVDEWVKQYGHDTREMCDFVCDFAICAKETTDRRKNALVMAAFASRDRCTGIIIPGREELKKQPTKEAEELKRNEIEKTLMPALESAIKAWGDLFKDKEFVYEATIKAVAASELSLECHWKRKQWNELKEDWMKEVQHPVAAVKGHVQEAVPLYVIPYEIPAAAVNYGMPVNELSEPKNRTKSNVVLDAALIEKEREHLKKWKKEQQILKPDYDHAKDTVKIYQDSLDALIAKHGSKSSNRSKSSNSSKSPKL